MGQMGGSEPGEEAKAGDGGSHIEEQVAGGGGEDGLPLELEVPHPDEGCSEPGDEKGAQGRGGGGGEVERERQGGDGYGGERKGKRGEEAGESGAGEAMEGQGQHAEESGQEERGSGVERGSKSSLKEVGQVDE